MFEKLSRRTQQLADSVVGRVENLIKEHDKFKNQIQELKRENLLMQRDYQSLVSIKEVRDILNKAEVEKSEYIKAFLASYDKASSK